MAALAITRVAVELAWYGAHTTLDFDDVTHALIGTWLTLAIGVVCAIAGIVVGRQRAQP